MRHSAQDTFPSAISQPTRQNNFMKQRKTAAHPVNDAFFKGWAKPGPMAPGALAAGLELGEDETLDAISGHFRLFQLRDGHRFSTDDVLTAWYGTSWCPTARTVLDLGSGVGSVGMRSEERRV